MLEDYIQLRLYNAVKHWQIGRDICLCVFLFKLISPTDLTPNWIPSHFIVVCFDYTITYVDQIVVYCVICQCTCCYDHDQPLEMAPPPPTEPLLGDPKPSGSTEEWLGLECILIHHPSHACGVISRVIKAWISSLKHHIFSGLLEPGGWSHYCRLALCKHF